MNKVFQLSLNRLFLILIFFNGTINSQPVEHPIPGEKIDFLVSFGIFSAGKATMSTAVDKYNINDKETFKIDVNGRTIGVFDFFARVRDNWGSYIDDSEFKPEKFYRYLAEGKYRKNEILNFQNDSDSVQIELLDKETKKFIESLGLNQNTHTTQIESHDYIANISNKLSHINSVLIGLSQDMWSYISKNYFIQKNVKGEVGSSTMPHKINPINFENAEGNLGLANSLLNYFSSKLVISRLQRDLSDSTTLRNIGVAFGYSIVAYKNILIGLDKISINKEQLSSELDESWEILAEPIQMIARKYSNKDPYELLKKFSRGKKLNREIIINIINSLDIPKREKNILLNLKPSDYLGYSISLSNE